MFKLTYGYPYVGSPPLSLWRKTVTCKKAEEVALSLNNLVRPILGCGAAQVHGQLSLPFCSFVLEIARQKSLQSSSIPRRNYFHFVSEFHAGEHLILVGRPSRARARRPPNFIRYLMFLCKSWGTVRQRRLARPEGFEAPTLCLEGRLKQLLKLLETSGFHLLLTLTESTRKRICRAGGWLRPRRPWRY